MRVLALVAAALALSACLAAPSQDAVDAAIDTARILGVDRYCVTAPVPFCVTLGAE